MGYDFSPKESHFNYTSLKCNVDIWSIEVTQESLHLFFTANVGRYAVYNFNKQIIYASLPNITTLNAACEHRCKSMTEHPLKVS